MLNINYSARNKLHTRNSLVTRKRNSGEIFPGSLNNYLEHLGGLPIETEQYNQFYQ